MLGHRIQARFTVVYLCIYAIFAWLAYHFSIGKTPDDSVYFKTNRLLNVFIRRFPQVLWADFTIIAPWRWKQSKRIMIFLDPMFKWIYIRQKRSQDLFPRGQNFDNLVLNLVCTLFLSQRQHPGRRFLLQFYSNLPHFTLSSNKQRPKFLVAVREKKKTDNAVKNSVKSG